jgi:heat shock protein HslJ
LIKVSIAVLLLFTGCKTAEQRGMNQAVNTAISLPSGSYRLFSLNGINLEQAEISNEITLNINLTDSTLSGFAGCNRFFASFSMKNDTMQIGLTVSTKMACSALITEEAYLGSLSGQHYFWKQSDDTLWFINRKHKLLYGKITP